MRVNAYAPVSRSRITRVPCPQAVPKGTIYAINPLIDLIAIPGLTPLLARFRHFTLIRLGTSVAAASPLLLVCFTPSVPSVVAFVLLLTLGDLHYNPRLQAYAMAVAPEGREGSFAGAMHAVAFLAELPAGMLGGWLIERHCSSAAVAASGAAGCDAPSLFGRLAAFALLTPLALWSCPSLLREPSADVRGNLVGDANTAAGGGERACEAVELRAATSEAESPDDEPLIGSTSTSHGGGGLKGRASQHLHGSPRMIVCSELRVEVAPSHVASGEKPVSSFRGAQGRRAAAGCHIP